MPMKRVTTREFLRNINTMTEPVEVFTRSTLKGTWYPSNTTWGTDLESGASIAAIREAHARVFAPAEPTAPTSEPRSVGADAGTPNEPSAGSFGVSRPAPKPRARKK